ncbi:MAG: hypothetical protein MZU95_00980 [Desulfomicrobium escambiense]|nr:hypothetical protein [Desulfomicrobium escambiense]
MLTFWSFVGLFIVTSMFLRALRLYLLCQDCTARIAQMNPVKWLANVSGVALIIGSILLIKTAHEQARPEESAYKDWLLHGPGPAAWG